ncbi:MAG: FAD-binding oxidoreductase, partial [Thermoleophilaceae bacterium]|nr:FAD-binding oxidoreductase [Thermoleophilaceae bacterium]
MATATRPRVEEPGSPEQAADVMRLASEDGLTIRPVGGRTKLGWGHPTPEPGIELSTSGLNDILEHNEGDFTVRAQAGMKWRDLQEKVAGAGQMLALDPPLGTGEGATLGGILATGDSGPQRHRYGSPRDLVLGVTLVLSDGTVARAGGKVIKNVAGYDLSKLFAGSFGTLGLVADMSLRLHPRPAHTATLTARAGDPESLGVLARTLSHS